MKKYNEETTIETLKQVEKIWSKNKLIDFNIVDRSLTNESNFIQLNFIFINFVLVFDGILSKYNKELAHRKLSNSDDRFVYWLNKTIVFELMRDESKYNGSENYRYYLKGEENDKQHTEES